MADVITNVANTLDKANEDVDKFNDQFNPNWRKSGGKIPYYVTGSRCLIKLAGQQLAVCQDFRWNVSYNATPIQTIDTPFPWDIDIGQVNIQATLNRIFNPTKGPEAEGLFPIMAAAVHQPMVELQVLYGVKPTTGSNTETVWLTLFFARGMFVGISSNATLGQIGQLSANFVGVAYQHYVAQNFTPYGVAAIAEELLNQTQDAVSSATGGWL